MTTSVPTVGAIETEYAGVRFRSRLEARHAVFFDAMGWQWHHEWEGYEWDGIRVLPDFWIPTLNAFWEVKPERLPYTSADRTAFHRKYSIPSMLTGKRMLISYGFPSCGDWECYPFYQHWLEADVLYPVKNAEWLEDGVLGELQKETGYAVVWDSPAGPTQSPKCFGWSVGFDGRPDRGECKCGYEFKRFGQTTEKKLWDAIQKARAHKFWNPATSKRAARTTWPPHGYPDVCYRMTDDCERRRCLGEPVACIK